MRYDGDGEDNANLKMCFYFTLEFLIYLDLFSVSVGIKTCRSEYVTIAFSFKSKYEKLPIVVHVLQTTQNLVISRCCFAEDGKEMYQELQRTCTAIVLLFKSFFLNIRPSSIINSFIFLHIFREFEAQIRTYEGEDPLDIWYRYAKDTMQITISLHVQHARHEF